MASLVENKPTAIEPTGNVKVLEKPSSPEVWYISGPMAGIPNYNRPLFEAVEEALQLRGFKVLSPHRIESHPNPDESTWEYFMRKALQMQLCCTHQCQLPGWERSKGARREFDVALDLGMPVFLYNWDGSLICITGKGRQ